MQELAPSLHVLEVFMPVLCNENFLIDNILPEVAGIQFYKGIEMPVIFRKENQTKLRRIVEENNYQLTIWGSPNINEKGYNLSSLDVEERKKAVDFTKGLLSICAESGTFHVGLPSGPDVALEQREEAKKALFDSYVVLAREAERLGINLTLEPLDRYAHKKQLMGPIHEVIDWFAELRKECPNYYIHWDSAHEALGGIDLKESLETALPYMAQFHICNCVTDPTNPCYGDWHMELGPAPEYQNWGYLNLKKAVDMLSVASIGTPPEGIEEVHVAVEVRTHLGDDMWKREGEARAFLMAAFDGAGLKYDK